MNENTKILGIIAVALALLIFLYEAREYKSQAQEIVGTALQDAGRDIAPVPVPAPAPATIQQVSPPVEVEPQIQYQQPVQPQHRIFRQPGPILRRIEGQGCNPGSCSTQGCN